MAKKLFGRKVLTADNVELSAENVGKILNKVIPLHLQNKADIEYLCDFYRGDQPALDRPKEIRPEIKNTVIENRALEIVEFKKGYEFSHPIQYTNAGLKQNAPVNKLNDYARLDSKEAKDLSLSEYFFKCGTSYRIVLPNLIESPDEAPYVTDVLDPKDTFVVYSNEIGNKRALLAGTYVIRGEGNQKRYICEVYTKKEHFTWEMKSTHMSSNLQL